MSEWRLDAACASADWEMFFDESREQEAKTVCASCRVQSECLAFINRLEGAGKPLMDGIWSGMNWTDRINWRKRARAQRYRNRKRDAIRKEVA